MKFLMIYAKVDLKGVILVYNLPLFDKYRPFSVIFDLVWPRVLWPRGLFRRIRKERHFDMKFAYFTWTLIFDPKWPQIFNLTSKSFFLESLGATDHFELSFAGVGWICVFKQKCKPEISHETGSKFNFLKIENQQFFDGSWQFWLVYIPS